MDDIDALGRRLSTALRKDDSLDQMASDDADSEDTESTAKAAAMKPDGSNDEKPDNDKEVKAGGSERNPFAFMKSFGSMSFMSPPRESEGVVRRGFSRPSSALSEKRPEEAAAAAAAEGGILREAPLQKPRPLFKAKTEPLREKMKSFHSTPSAGSVFAARADGVDRKAADLPFTQLI